MGSTSPCCWRACTRRGDANICINDGLELDAVLQRVLTGTRYGVLTILDQSGRRDDLLASGLSPEGPRSLYTVFQFH